MSRRMATALLLGCAVLMPARAEEPSGPPPAYTPRVLPDLARGQRAAAAGQLLAAENDLRPLAERGYLEAQLALARVYARSASGARITEAIVWMRRAQVSAPQRTAVPLARLLLRRGDGAALNEAEALLDRAYAGERDPEALAGLIRLYTQAPQRPGAQRLPRLLTQAERIGADGGEELLTARIAWYRATAQEGDHAQELLTLCGRYLPQVPECYVDLLREARRRGDQDGLQRLSAGAQQEFQAQRLNAQTLAAAARVLNEPPDAGEDPAAVLGAAPLMISDVPEAEDEAMQPPAARSCEGEPLPPVQPPQAGSASAPQGPPPASAQVTALLKTLLASDAAAQLAAAGVLLRDPQLLGEVDLKALLEKLRAQGETQAWLPLGELYLQGSRTPRDASHALQALQQASALPDTAVQAHYFLGRLYQYGYLDESAPQLAAQHLLWAARQGYAPADAALAQLYARGHGLCPDLVNADLFAQLGAGASPAAARLLKQLQPLLDERQREVVAQRLQGERAYRAAQPPLSTQTQLAQEASP